MNTLLHSLFLMVILVLLFTVSDAATLKNKLQEKNTSKYGSNLNKSLEELTAFMGSY